MDQTKKRYRTIRKIPGIILLAAVLLAGTVSGEKIMDQKQPKFYAWWGTIYPEFCFEKVENTGENKPVKISFWLAKALDW